MDSRCTNRSGWVRTLPALALGGVLVCALTWASAGPVRRLLAGGPAAVLRDYPAALSGTAAALAWLVVLWYAGCLGLALLSRLPGTSGRLAESVAARTTPAAVRRLVEATLGAGVVVGGTAQLAYAAPAHAPLARAVGHTAAHCLDRADHRAVEHTVHHTADRADPRIDLAALADLPVPDRPAGPAHRPSGHQAGDHRDDDHGTRTGRSTGHDRHRRQDRRAPPVQVLVRPGDTLWAIAADHLPEDPTVRRIAATWPRWYAANRDVIGPDPDLIRPGQRLRPPGRG